MKKLLILVILTISFVGGKHIFAQQEAMYSHFMFNQVIQNPAYAGNVKAIDITGVVHQQWIGFTDSQGNHVAPETNTIAIHAPLDLIHGGLGLVIDQDNEAYFKRFSVKLLYSYRKNVGIGNIGIGAYVGVINAFEDVASLKTEGGNIIDQNDPVLENILNDKGDMLLDMGFGVHYQVPGKYYVGLSTTRIPQSSSPEEELAYKTRRHYFLSGGYEYTLPFKPEYTLKPSLLIKTDFGSVQATFAGMLEYNKKIWGGVSYSTFMTSDPINIMMGMYIKDIRVGYSYGLPTSVIGSNGTHEVFIGYRFNLDFERSVGSYHNTRYF
jgi:type IX secretion system PorP/SprF family membrane protein